jgi:6-phosphogluconolactonase (cycloisomerase 2 family)
MGPGIDSVGSVHRPERGDGMSRVSKLVRSAIVAMSLAVVPLSNAGPALAVAPAGHVYVQTNSASGNAVVSFARAANGALTHEETVPTGGRGLGAGLGSQAALAITADGDHLLVVNAGSDNVSIFDITSDGLELADRQRVGDRPVSLDVHGSLVYVVNQGADTILGLRITDDGELTRLRGSRRVLSGSGVDAAQIAFSPSGRILAVTEKATQTIDTWLLRADDRPRRVKAQHSEGATPFGFEFGPDGRLYVSEAPTSSVSSYDVSARGAIDPITSVLSNGQGAACWLVVSADGDHAYTGNTSTANVSRYGIAANGTLSLEAGIAGTTPPGTVDLDLTDGDGFLYALSSSGAITGFSVDPGDGSLTAAGGVGLAAGHAGLIAV